MTTPFRRVVTGHDSAGQSVVVSDGPPPRVVQIGGEAGPTFYEVWNTRETPALIDRTSEEPEETDLTLAPPAGGTRIRVIDFPPESAEIRQLTDAAAREQFTAMGGARRRQPVRGTR